MEYVWSESIDQILGIGRPLEDIGIRNWALDRRVALTAVAQLAEIGVAVLGGDVYSVTGSVVESNYDNWHCSRKVGETETSYVARSLDEARRYIANYKATEGTVLFSLVPKT